MTVMHLVRSAPRADKAPELNKLTPQHADDPTVVVGAAPRWHSLLFTRKVLWMLLLECLVALVVAYGLWTLRQQTLNSELRMLSSFSAGMAAQADSTLDVADTVLRATRAELGSGLVRPDSAAVHELLRARASALPQFRSLVVFDAEGRLLATSRDEPTAALPIPPPSVVHNDFFVAARDSKTPQIYVGEPYISRTSGLQSIGVSMDWRNAEGQFMGVVALVADPAFLDGDFKRLAPTPDCHTAFYRKDMALPTGENDSHVGVRLPPGVTPAQWQATNSPVALLMDLPDGRKQLLAAQPLRRFPMMAVVTRDVHKVLIAWDKQAWLVGSFAAVALFITLMLTLRNAREQALRLAAQVQSLQLEDQLQRSRKLEALGTLVGGIAHDFNNILAAVIGYGELAREAAAPGSGQARQLDQVLQGGLRGKALVERIMSFSRAGRRPHVHLRLEPVISEVLELLVASLPPNVWLDRHLMAPHAVVLGDSTMVYEAAMNLCTNALHAMPDGGTLKVELVEIDLPGPLAMFERSLAPGRYVRLSVADTGCGIAPAVMARLFEPFFTTRGPHKGTGLGLSVVHGVMADLNGGIDVRTEPGKGSRFVLYFPCTDAIPAGEDAASAEPVPRGQGQTVLVVDDEIGLVELTEELLAELGYEPVGFSSSLQALQEFTAHPERFDLVITDEVMPEMTGTALTAALHALRPEMPVLLASGYGGPQLEARAAAAGVAVLVSKPLVRAELARAVAQALRAG